MNVIRKGLRVTPFRHPLDKACRNTCLLVIIAPDIGGKSETREEMRENNLMPLLAVGSGWPVRFFTAFLSALTRHRRRRAYPNRHSACARQKTAACAALGSTISMTGAMPNAARTLDIASVTRSARPSTPSELLLAQSNFAPFVKSAKWPIRSSKNGVNVRGSAVFPQLPHPPSRYPFPACQTFGEPPPRLAHRLPCLLRLLPSPPLVTSGSSTSSSPFSAVSSLATSTTVTSSVTCETGTMTEEAPAVQKPAARKRGPRAAGTTTTTTTTTDDPVAQ